MSGTLYPGARTRGAEWESSETRNGNGGGWWSRLVGRDREAREALEGDLRRMQTCAQNVAL